MALKTASEWLESRKEAENREKTEVRRDFFRYFQGFLRFSVLFFFAKRI
jgi:hypothetical protein